MVKIEPKTIKMITTTEEEIFEKLVKQDNVFRKLNELIDFEELVSPYRELYSDTGAQGIDVIKGFKSLLVQFWEDYSDREMEKAVEENMAVKWFCGFELLEETPDHSYFGKLRKRLGTKNVADIFNKVNGLLRGKGLFGDVFKFIDASALITKTALWDERDKAIKAGEEKLNNQNVKNYTADKDARWGAKNKNQPLDSWRSKTRMPFESVFSKQKKRTKFRGQTKVLFQCFAEAICYNLKKAIAILPSQLGA